MLYHGTLTDSSRALFVQVTNAHKHSFRIQYFHGWLALLSDHLKWRQSKLVFVVAQANLSNFQLSSVSGGGLLADFG